MPIQVLFADDQIPTTDDAANKAVREELVSMFSEEAYEEDRQWFLGLLNFLDTQNLKIDPVQTHEGAKRKISEGRFDIAVIDLSWNGDAALGPDKPNATTKEKKAARRNKGLELLEMLSPKRMGDKYKPAIAFSMNFEKELADVNSVLEHEALAVQKVIEPPDHSAARAGYSMLACAIKLLTRLRPSRELSIDDNVLAENATDQKEAVVRAERRFSIALLGAYVVIIATIVLVAFVPDIPQPMVEMILNATGLLGVGGGGLVLWTWLQLKAVRKLQIEATHKLWNALQKPK